MKKNKLRLLALACILCLLAGFIAGCGGGSAPANNAPANNSPASNSPANNAPANNAPANNAPANNAPAENTPAAPAVEPVTLKLSWGQPLNSMVGTTFVAFCDLVEELSEGTIIMEKYPGGSLTTDTNTIDGLVDGVIDIAHDTPAPETGIIKDVAALDIPCFYVGSDWVGFARAIQEPLSDIYADFGIKLIGAAYDAEAAFISNKKLIKTPADLVGLSFRAQGSWVSRAISEWGGAPTTIPLNELSTALERKTVDGAYTSWGVVSSQSLFESCDYVTFTNITMASLLLMSQGVYDKLAPVQKAAIDEASRRWPDLSYEIGRQFYDDAYQRMVDNGNTVYKMTPAEEKAFSDMIQSLFDEYAATCSAKGTKLLSVLQSLK